MKQWLSVFVVLMMLTGCSTPPYKPDPKDTLFTDISNVQRDVTYPTELPKFPKFACLNKACEQLVFQADQFILIEQYKDISEANKIIAEGNAEAIEASMIANDYLIQAGTMSERMTEITAEMLREEQYRHSIDVWFYRGTLLLLGAFAL